jgi:hypothetical protein
LRESLSRGIGHSIGWPSAVRRPVGELEVAGLAPGARADVEDQLIALDGAHR